jgi:type IV pilus assembly protein PilP
MVRSPLLLVLMLGVAPGVHAQSPTPAPKPAAPAAAAAPAPQAPATAPAAGTPQPEPQGFTYNPEGRRDPFVSLLRRGGDAQRGGAGARPVGLPGLSVSEVVLKGTVASRGGFVAIVQGVDSKTYIVRTGDKLLDGSVRNITQDTMVLTQQVNDPLSLEKQREVRKVLRQTDEAK